MSVTQTPPELDDATITSSPTLRQVHIDPEWNEFQYRPVPVLAVVGLVLALLSVAGLFLWMVLPLCLLAVLISGMSYWSIQRSQGGYSGKGVALSGAFLGLAFFCGGVGQQIYTYQTEVPAGYERISFSQDISEKEIVSENGELKPAPEVAALEGKKVFLKGYIYQTREVSDLTSFLLVKDNADCCFGGKPKLWDRLGVVMQDGKTINYRAGKVAIAGTFRLNPKFQGNDELEPIYIVEGDIFSGHVSDF